MNCIYCGKELEEGSVFCGYCGKKQPSVKKCVQCGHEIDIDDMFCGYCGASQEVSAEQKSMDMDSKQSNISEEHDSNQKEQSLEIESTESTNSPKADANVVDSSMENPLESDNAEIANTQEKDPNIIDIPHNQEDLSSEVEDIHIQNEDKSDELFSINKNKLILMISIPLLLLFIGGYVYFSRNNNARLSSDEKTEAITSVAFTDEEFKTESVFFHKENKYANTEIKVDYPISGNEQLLHNIRSFILDELTNTYTWDKPMERYTGDVSDGRTVLDFYGKNKMAILQEESQKEKLDTKIDESINILIKKEDDLCITYEVNFSGFHGGTPSSTNKGVTFVKKSGNRLRILANPDNKEFKELLITKLKKERDWITFYDSFYENPFPKTEPVLTDEGLAFFYDREEIAPMIEGEISITIPYNVIGKFLTEEAKMVIDDNSHGNTEDCFFTFDKAYEMLNPQKIHSEKAVEDYFESLNLPKVMAERYIWDEDWGGDSPAVHYCWGNGIQFKGYKLLPTTNDYFGIEFILFMGIKKGSIPRFGIISSSKKWYDKFMKDAKEKGLSSGSLGNLYLNDTSSEGKYAIEIGYSNEDEDV